MQDFDVEQCNVSRSLISLSLNVAKDFEQFFSYKYLIFNR